MKSLTAKLNIQSHGLRAKNHFAEDSAREQGDLNTKTSGGQADLCAMKSSVLCLKFEVRRTRCAVLHPNDGIETFGIFALFDSVIPKTCLANYGKLQSPRTCRTVADPDRGGRAVYTKKELSFQTESLYPLPFYPLPFSGHSVDGGGFIPPVVL